MKKGMGRLAARLVLTWGIATFASMAGAADLLDVYHLAQERLG